MDYKKIVATRLKENIDLDLDKIESLIEIPPKSDMGDFAFPCFKLAKSMRKAPPVIANEIKEKMKVDDVIERIDVAGGYLNFFINKEGLVKHVLIEALEKGEN